MNLYPFVLIFCHVYDYVLFISPTAGQIKVKEIITGMSAIIFTIWFEVNLFVQYLRLACDRSTMPACDFPHFFQQKHQSSLMQMILNPLELWEESSQCSLDECRAPAQTRGGPSTVSLIKLHLWRQFVCLVFLIECNVYYAMVFSVFDSSTA